MKSRVITRGAFLACLVLSVSAASAQGASGEWERAWGQDVDSVVAGTGPEICTVAANCKNGLNTAKLGGEFDVPADVASDAAGNVYVVDALNSRVQKFDSNGNFLRLWGKDVIGSGLPGDTGTGFEICTVAANCKIGVIPNGLGGELNQPRGIAVDSQGNVYVGDAQNSRIQKFDSSGNFLRLWGQDVIGTGLPGDTGTGFEICTVAANCKKAASSTGLGGEMTGGQGLAIDASNNVYVADGFNSERVQKFDSNGNFLRLWGKDVIGTGLPGDTGTGFEICTVAANCKNGITTTGLGGEFNDPSRIAVDGAGDVYVTDVSSHRVQKFDSNGNFLRLWGKDVIAFGLPGDTGSGPEICTVAANCKNGPTTTGLGGEFVLPSGIAADSSGAIYVSEFNGHRIQKFDSNGNFLRLWGQNVASAGPGNTGTGFEICVAGVDTCQNASNALPSLGGQMIGPAGLGTDATGNLYVADQSNMRIQKFTPDPAPVTTIEAGASTFGTASPGFTLTSSDAGSTFECSVDGGAFAPCVSPFTTPVLADGAHQLQVRATDPARQVDVTPDSRAFITDTAAPETQIDSGPAAGGTTDDSTPSFDFSASEAGSTFECRIDAEQFAACSGPGLAHTTAALADGGHTFEVRATDPIGNVDDSPAAREFTVDAVPASSADKDPPETTIAKAPNRKSFKRKAKFEFSSNEAGSSFECQLDKGNFEACAAKATFKVKAGKHTLQVRATDAAGNVDLTPAKSKWKVKKRR
jgi:hypothetical protein